jgi:2-polyprenyl-6-methoxyphenol hydroxylase-like FAD-dependent oxidoreductase
MPFTIVRAGVRPCPGPDVPAISTVTGMAERILIVGGGIAGLTLLRALSGGPWEVDLVESRRSPGRLGAGLAVQPNAVRALASLGLAPAVAAAGAVIDTFQYRDQRGALLCDIDLSNVWAGVGPFVGISREALHDTLSGAGGRVGVAVTAVTKQDSLPRVTFDDGRTGEYDLVVAADGIHSIVRRCLSNRPQPLGAGQIAWRSLAPIRLPGVDGVQFWLGSDRFFGLCPAGPELTYGFGNVSGVPAPDPVRGRKHRLIERFAGFGPPVLDYLAAVERDDDIHCAPVEWLPQVADGAGRVALIGDAAHAMSPMMGQGGAMAIEDAVVLAGELRANSDIPTALGRFERRRRARVDWVRRQSAALGELLRLPPPIRDAALRTRGAVSFRERFGPLTAAP